MRIREQFNDALRWMLSRTLCWWGLLLQVVHQFRIGSFDWNQRRLRHRYGIDVNMPISGWDTQTERRLLQRVGKDSQLAQTSGSTTDPKRIPYSLRRLRSVRWTFQEFFSRAIWALGIRRTSLYFFGSLSRDRSLTSIVLAEKKLPLYLMTLQAPYRLQSHPAVQELVNSYGTVAVRLWILVLSNPGILYSTNPSTLLVFFEELVSNWTRSVCLLRDYYEKPHQFRPSVHQVVRRLVSRGSQKRVARVARAEGPVDLKVFCPGVQAYACWTSGYSEPFLQRLQTILPPNRYRLIPMYSMSTETIETLTHFQGRRVGFLPLAGGVLYEFLEQGEADQAENLKGACDLEMDKTYSLVVSDAYGLQRYQTEDLFQVRGFFGRLPDLHFISRRGLEYSFTGEKVTDEQLESVYQQLCEDWPELKEARFLTCLPSYPSGDPVPHYKIVLVGGHPDIEAWQVQEIEIQADSLLSQANREYWSKRESGRLGLTRLETVSLQELLEVLAPEAWESQSKLLPLYTRTWESLKLQGKSAHDSSNQGIEEAM